MRIVSLKELMTLPTGTLCAEVREKWVFNEVFIKDETIAERLDCWILTLPWTNGDNCGECIDQLEGMAVSNVSFQSNRCVQRLAEHDEATQYLVYEPDDTRHLIEVLTQSLRTAE